MEGHWKFLGGGGILEGKILEAEYEAKLEFPGGRGFAKQKNLLWGEYGYFLELHDIYFKLITYCPAGLYIAFYLCVMACYSIMSVPYNGLIADLTPPFQRGKSFHNSVHFNVQSFSLHLLEIRVPLSFLVGLIMLGMILTTSDSSTSITLLLHV